MNKKVRQHTVSEFYLKFFVDPRNLSSLWMYEKGNLNIRKVAPDNAAVEKHFYSLTNLDGSKNYILEDLLGDIETEVGPIFRKIQNKETLDNMEKSRFASFLNVMATRVHNFKECLKIANIEMVNNLMKFAASDPEKFKASLDSIEIETGEKFYNSIEEFEDFRKMILNIEEHFKLEPNPNLILLQWEKLVTNPEICKMYYDMNWTFLIAQGDYKFLTSDNPVFRYDPEWNPESNIGVGLSWTANSKIEITFPISKDMAFLGTFQNIPRGYVEADDKITKQINRRTIISASRFVFSSQKSDLLNSIVQKYRDCQPTMEVEEADQSEHKAMGIPNKERLYGLTFRPYNKTVLNQLSSLTDSLQKGKKFAIFIPKL